MGHQKPVMKTPQQTSAEREMEALRKRNRATRFRVHFVCGVFVGAISGFFVWAKMVSHSVSIGVAPLEQWMKASNSPIGGIVVVGGIALIGGLLAAAKDDD